MGPRVHKIKTEDGSGDGGGGAVLGVGSVVGVSPSVESVSGGSTVRVEGSGFISGPATCHKNRKRMASASRAKDPEFKINFREKIKTEDQEPAVSHEQ